ncbi:GH11882 [Drosophila grimshawi]|uniref:GH11882 n=1 Tax=Drosophila grimshawi TaxID=7222 RepID=B4JLE9_DROGR|nr:GH11882 [Drosophila grimshawi]
MNIYDYLRQHFKPASKRNRNSYSDCDDELHLPQPKVRKHNYNNYRKQQQQQQQQQEREQQHEKRGKHGPNSSSTPNYDIRIFFYVNSLILFTMSCRQYEGDEFKHFIVHHIREFDRLRRKARKRRKRKMKATTELSL